MLTPEQLAHCTDDIVELYTKLNEEIVRDIARRVAKASDVTPTGRLQILALQNVGMLTDDILQTVSKYSGMSDSLLYDLFEDAGIMSVEYDMEIYTKNGLNPLPLNMSPAAMQTLEAGYRKTNGNLRNLTGTTAVTSQTNFINACTMAEMKAESGAFSPQQAIIDAVKQLAADGAVVRYPSGHKDKLDVAVRRNVMTGIGQTTGEICLGYARDLEWDLMEITAHAGARPSHAKWQGQIVSLSGRKGYLSLDDIGYGTGEGFKGYNCRHDWYPYSEGSARMYSAEEIAKLNAKNIEFPDGSMHTLYEAEQYQRAYERRIRETRRQIIAQDELMKNVSDEQTKQLARHEFDKFTVKLKEQEKKLSDFCDYTGLRVDSSRVQTLGFGKSLSQSVVQRNKKINAVCDMYKVDFGHMNKLKIFELDRKALTEKLTNFISKFKNSGNFAIMEYGKQYYYAHSMANVSEGVETTAFAKYKGDKSHLARTSVKESERNFKTFDVKQDTGEKIPKDFSGDIRTNTFEDTEAKMFESLENLWYNSKHKTINILSERGMCDSCKSVAVQFMEKHPEARVNIASGKSATKISWRGRKSYA